MSPKSSNRYPPELRERTVRLLLEQHGGYDAIRAIVPKIGCHTDTLRSWLRQHEPNTGTGDNDLTTRERPRFKEPEREVRGLRRSNDILRQASAYFARAEPDRHWKK